VGVYSGGYAAPAALAGLRRSVDVDWGIASLANLSGDSTAVGVLTQILCGVDRFGGVLPNSMVTGGNAYLIGSNGKGANTLGQKSVGGVQAVYMLGGGAVGSPPLDIHCAFAPTPFLDRPPEDFDDPRAVWEVGAIMRCGIPAAAITRDLGLILHANTVTTGYPVGMRGSSITPNTDAAGFGLVFSGAQGTDLRFIARRTDTVSALTRDVTVATLPQAARYYRLALRIFSATRDREARLVALLNGRPIHEESWGVGTVLPSRSTITLNPTRFCGAFRPFVRNDTDSTQVTELGVRSFYVRAASSEAELL
jgi:hypothetical protein